MKSSLLKALIVTVCLLGIVPALCARQRYQNWCQQGGQAVTTSGINSTTLVQRSFQVCTVTVYAAGSTTLKTLYSDDSGTSLANPFSNQDQTDGIFYFYTDNARVDIKIAATGLTTYTLGDVEILDSQGNSFFVSTTNGTSRMMVGSRSTFIRTDTSAEFSYDDGSTHDGAIVIQCCGNPGVAWTAGSPEGFLTVYGFNGAGTAMQVGTPAVCFWAVVTAGSESSVCGFHDNTTNGVTGDWFLGRGGQGFTFFPSSIVNDFPGDHIVWFDGGSIKLDGAFTTGARVTGAHAFTGLSGIELSVSTNIGLLASYDRTNTLYREMDYDALTHVFKASGAQQFAINSTGPSFWGTSNNLYYNNGQGRMATYNTAGALNLGDLDNHFTDVQIYGATGTLAADFLGAQNKLLQGTRILGSGTFTGLGGIELTHDGTTGKIISYDRTNALYKAMVYDGLSHTFNTSNTLVMSLNAGVQVGAPTGGDKGAGTINVATNIFLNNTAYTNPDAVLEKWATGNIVKFADRPWARDYHIRTLNEVEEFAKTHFYLPQLDYFGAHESSGIKQWFDASLMLHEEEFVHLIELESRIQSLEKTIRSLENSK